MVTSQPRFARERAMLRLAPRSRSATFLIGFSNSSDAGRMYFSLQEVFFTTPVTVYACMRVIGSVRSSYCLVVIMPFMVPFSRKILVSARVSTPLMPGMSYFSRKF